MHANNQRFTKSGEEEQNENILVNDEWMALLQQQPFQSQKKGRFINLLKSGSKPAKEMKPKKKYEPLNIMEKLDTSFGKRIRESPDKKKEEIK